MKHSPKSIRLLSLTSILVVLALLLPAVRNSRRPRAQGPGSPDQQLLDAVKAGDLDLVRALLVEGADVQARDDNGRTALHMAAYRGHSEVADFLVAKGADVNATSDKGETPLHCSGVLRCHPDIFRQHGMGRPFEQEVKTRQAVAQRLLSHGAKVDTVAAYHWTPLHLAAYCGNRGVAELLLAQGASVSAVDSEGNTPLHVAVFGRTRVAELLLDESTADKPHGCSAVMHCHAYPTDAGVPAAGGAGAKKVLRVVARSHGKVLELGLVCDSERSKKRQPLDDAGKGRREVAELLLTHGADANAKTFSGWTPLHYAAALGYAHLVEVLLPRGADASVKDSAGRTPLALAVEAGYSDLAEVLQKDRKGEAG